LTFVDVPNDIYIKGIMGIYELNRVELFKDVFIWAYQRSAQRYAALRQSLGEPDPFRLKYRDIMREIITEIISNAMSHSEAMNVIAYKANTLPTSDQSKFIETVETELLSLHEGNFARYRARPSAFKEWKKVWETQ